MKNYIYLLLLVFAFNANAQYSRAVPPPSGDSTFVISAHSRADAVDGFCTLTPASSSSSSSYLVYTALLTQSGTSAPVATVLDNTLGGAVVWTRNTTGDYTGTLTGAFTSGKTVLLSPQPLIIQNEQSFGIMERTSDNAVRIYTWTIDGGSWSASDDLLGSTTILIYVYQ